MTDLITQIQPATDTGLHVLIGFLLVGAALVALLGSPHSREPAAIFAVLLAATAVLVGLASWFLTMLGPFQDPHLLDRLWLPLVSVGLAAAIWRPVHNAVVRPQPADR